MGPRLFIEAIIVGIVLVIIGSLVSYVTNPLTPNLPKVCDEWNKYRVMEISLFMTGFLTHLLFEAVGANKWYCSNGNACRE